jgi:hypothetical protein
VDKGTGPRRGEGEGLERGAADGGHGGRGLWDSVMGLGDAR